MNKFIQKCKGGVSKSLFLSLSVVLCLVAKGAWADEDSSASGSSSSKEITYVCWDGTPGFSTYGYGEDPTSLFLSDSERKDGDKWCCTQSNNPYVIFEASEGGKLKGYTIKTANDNERETGRNPKTWTLYGSKNYGSTDEPTWEVITTVTDDKILEDRNFTSYEYKLNEPSTKYYRYFKWVISANKGNREMQVSELKLDLETCPHEKNGKSTLTYMKDVAANCKWPAHKLYHCSLCDLDVKEFTGTELGAHDLEYVPSNATCQIRGYKAHYLCKICKRMYWDADGKRDFYRDDLAALATVDHNFVDGYCTYCGKGETKTYGNFQYTVDKNTQEVTIVKYTGNESTVTFPSEIDGKIVTTIGAGWDEGSMSGSEDARVFSYENYLSQVVIPSSVKKINSRAFMQARVSEVKFEGDDYSSTKDLTIVSAAFSNSSIEKIELPARTLVIGNGAFDYCQNLKEVKLGFKPTDETPTSIGYNIFGYPNDSYGFPQDLIISVDKTLEEQYKQMDGLSTYKDYINRKINMYGDFQYDINENEGTVTITKYKGNAENVEIPASIDGMAVTAIDANAFSNNGYLSSVSIPANVETIGDNAFQECRSLKNVKFAENGQLKRIGYGAFRYTILEQITLPASVSYIGGCAFYNYDNTLKEVNMLGDTPPTLDGSDVFGYTPNYTIYVGSEDIANTFKYQWSRYADYIKVKEGGFSTSTDITDDNGSTQGCTLMPATYEREKLTYKRHFNEAGQYATICLPFSVSAQQAAEVFEGVWTFTDNDVKFITRSSVGNYTLHFSAYDKHNGLKANQPYYVKLKSNVQEVSFTNYKEETLTIVPSTLTSQVYDETTGEVIDNISIKVFGNFQNLTGGDYYTFNADGTFGKSSYVYPYRMYLTITTQDAQVSAPAFFSIGIGGNGTTGINGMTSGIKATEGKVYNISGQLVNANGDVKGLPKGVYVKNGKKFVVK